jgi:dipeptidase E
MRVAGLREGCLLRIEGDRRELVGDRPMRIFRHGDAPHEVNPAGSLEFLWSK